MCVVFGIMKLDNFPGHRDIFMPKYGSRVLITVENAYYKAQQQLRSLASSHGLELPLHLDLGRGETALGRGWVAYVLRNADKCHGLGDVYPDASEGYHPALQPILRQWSADARRS